MMTDTTIYGYVTDGGAYHVTCTDARPDGNRDDVTALYYLHDEDPHGMTCDGCSEYIFEPVDPHDAARCDYGCSGYCGESGTECFLHGEDTDPVVDREPDTVPLAWETLREFWADRPESAR